MAHPGSPLEPPPLCTALNFIIYVPDFDPDPYRLGSTMLFFRNNNTVPLFLYRVRTAQQTGA